jgi:hypothetical protein
MKHALDLSALTYLVLVAITPACAGSASSVPSAATPVQPEVPLPQAQATQDGVEVGSPCGESRYPQVGRWQSAMLKAIGREGQYELFDYVFADRTVYIGLRTTGFSDAELGAARQVEAQFASDPVETRERGDLILARAWTTSNTPIARAE